MEHGPDILAIPGTKKIKHLEENLGAYRVSLTQEESIEVRRVIDDAEVAGTRVAEHLMGALVMDSPPLTNCIVQRAHSSLSVAKFNRRSNLLHHLDSFSE